MTTSVSNMASHLDIPSRLGPTETLAWFAPWHAVADAPELVLRGLGQSKLEPAGLTALTAGLARRRERKLSTRLESGTEGDGLGHLVRMSFFRELAIDVPAATANGSDSVVVLRAIGSEKIAESVARDCEALLEAQLPEFPSSLRRFARNVVEELGVNIVQHSRAPETGFALARAWEGDAPRLQISAADAGVGFLASFQRHPEFAGRVQEEGEALQLALQTGLSASDSPANSGFGLGMLRFLADQLGAELWIASGQALLHRRTVAGQRATSVRSIPAWRGSWICLDAPLISR
jgi:hypothetical protein